MIFYYRGGCRGGARGGPGPVPLLFWVKKEETTKGRKAGWASKIKPGPLLSLKSGSATVFLYSFSVPKHLPSNLLNYITSELIATAQHHTSAPKVFFTDTCLGRGVFLSACRSRNVDLLEVLNSCSFSHTPLRQI